MRGNRSGLWAIGLMWLAQAADANPAEKSLRPVERPTPVSFKTAPQTEPVASTAGLRKWAKEFQTRAESEGIDPDLIASVFKDAVYDEKIIKRDRNQSEFTKTIWDYLDTAVSDVRVSNGRTALRRHEKTLQAIEKKFGVDKEVVVAVWGLESAYGSFRGSNNTLNSLATLAYDGRRGAFFETQLIAALRILENGDTTASNMKGSWAGAMGHTQFMPTSFLEHAIDFTGDGKRDIWSDDPTDALASTAAYLASFGWQKNVPWGIEVRVPEGFDYTLANRDITKSSTEWQKLGITAVTGSTAKIGPTSLLLPAGAKGAAFLITPNFDVIEHYNTADAYVIGIGHLSDRLKGRPAIQAKWPRDDRALTKSERIELQTNLTAKGFDTQKIDGKIGPLTINAVRAYQIRTGMIPDGYASLRLLKSLR
ncbi:lytic murein transglycosylase [Ascidiaceihabitans sp.]|uniref:lytic murein transglycosylase n=1 Tax=Ascidiaceihabitans sp. TaxID=1872644 RepID=UPI003297FA01